MALNSGTVLQQGKYIIVRHISNGGFGVTYEAEHALLHKRLAIKEFFVKDFCNRNEETKHVTVGTQSKAQLVNKLKQKFIDEAVALSSFSHPNIVHVSDVFEENGTAYYVMDYIDGKSLHEHVNDNGPLPEAVAIDYIRQVAGALQYVHDNNRLHLDIKPGNIMVDNVTHKAILIDFGASKQYDEVDGVNTSTLLGKTPGYAPIEQMGNRVQTFNPATDVYSLGATLYKLLSGTTPPNATDIADDDTLLKPLPSAVSDNVRRTVAKCMELKRKNRPQSMGEFMTMLESGPNDEEPTLIGIDIEQTSQTSESEESGNKATRLYRKTIQHIQSHKKAWLSASVAFVAMLIVAGAGWTVRKRAMTPQLARYSYVQLARRAVRKYVMTSQATTQKKRKEDTTKHNPSFAEAASKLQSKPKEALMDLERLAAEGNSDATFLLSRLYFKSGYADDAVDSIVRLQRTLNITTDNAKAHEMLLTAIKQDTANYKAAYELGRDYKAGHVRDASYTRDFDKALKMFASAEYNAQKANDSIYAELAKEKINEIKELK